MVQILVVLESIDSGEVKPQGQMPEWSDNIFPFYFSQEQKQTEMMAGRLKIS